jgi:hypothetical protein
MSESFNDMKVALARFNVDGSLDDGGPSDTTPGTRSADQAEPRRDSSLPTPVVASEEWSRERLALAPDGSIIVVAHAVAVRSRD